MRGSGRAISVKIRKTRPMATKATKGPRAAAGSGAARPAPRSDEAAAKRKTDPASIAAQRAARCALR
jgi:hypothetical protein